MKRATMVAVVVSLVLAAGALADTIDDFTSPSAGWSMELGVEGGTTTVVQTKVETGLAGVLGGSRSWTFTSAPHTYTWSTGTWTTSGGNDAMVYPDGPWDGRMGFFISNGDSMNGECTLSVLYDADGAGLNLDFTQAGAIELDLNSDHFGYTFPTVISLTLADSSGSQTVSKTYATYTASNVWSTESFALTSFNLIDLSDIQSLNLTYAKDAANDLAFDALRATGTIIPEPATMALLALGGALTFLGRRK